MKRWWESILTKYSMGADQWLEWLH